MRVLAAFATIILLILFAWVCRFTFKHYLELQQPSYEPVMGSLYQPDDDYEEDDDMVFISEEGADIDDDIGRRLR